MSSLNRAQVCANGVNGLTGEYLLPPLNPTVVAARARRAADDPRQVTQLKKVHRKHTEPAYGLPFTVRPEDLARAGWAIVFSTEENDEVRAALEPLIAYRGGVVEQARFKRLDYQPGEEWAGWLRRHGTAPGNVDPEKVPYYLLLVGSPERIPFSFQYLLDVEYAVGRLDFDDADGYGRYVIALIDYYSEGHSTSRDASVAFFGTRHPHDGATQLSADWLVSPLAKSFAPGGRFERDVVGYRIETMIGEQATKSTLAELLGGTGSAGRPTLLFSATHGLGGWPPGHADQLARHGALLCQDWRGAGRISPGDYLSASDIGADARVHGLIAFCFACFSAGTPEFDTFAHISSEHPSALAAKPFTASLPKRLLSHEEGAALAVIGHIDRAWGYSFASGGESQLVPFQNAVGRILIGEPIGHAMKDFNERFAALSTRLSNLLEEIQLTGKIVSDEELARLWAERNDSRNYVLLGDPAVALKRV
jgi:hypothetical protein